MAEKIPQHVHCHLCWKAIPVGETYCSDECKKKAMAIYKKRRILWYFILVLIVVFTIMVFVGF